MAQRRRSGPHGHQGLRRRASPLGRGGREYQWLVKTSTCQGQICQVLARQVRNAIAEINNRRVLGMLGFSSEDEAWDKLLKIRRCT
jgi:hypothetical protein